MKNLILFLSLQAADLITTVLVFNHGGHELNPAISSIFPWVGPVGGVAVMKLVLAISALALYYYRERFAERFNPLRVLKLASYAYCAIVCWNAAMLAV